MNATSAMFVCRNTTYCPTPEYFDTVSAFQAMCSDRFDKAPVLTYLTGMGMWADETGVVVLELV